MAINKVIDRNNNVLLDLTNDNIKANKVLAGTSFHDNEGNVQEGTLLLNDLDCLKYNFIDYDGEIVYSLTDQEVDNLTSMPSGPNHTDENLTFDGWNWDLEDLKNWNRDRTERPIIGANYITTDKKTYIYLDIPVPNQSFSFGVESSNFISIDWGDGTIENNLSSDAFHTYTQAGEYVVAVEISEKGYLYFYTSACRSFIKSIKLGTTSHMEGNLCNSLYNLETITIPNGEFTSLPYNLFSDCYHLKCVVVPKKIKTIYGSCFRNCYSSLYISLPKNLEDIMGDAFTYCNSIKNIIIPDGAIFYGGAFSYCANLERIFIPEGTDSLNGIFNYCYSLKNVNVPSTVTSFQSQAFMGCYSLENINVPNSVTKITDQCFYNCYSLKYIKIPDSVITMGSNVFYNCSTLVLDLSEQTKVIPLSGSIGNRFSLKYGSTILVPASLLDAYKSASYWSNAAECMIAV